MAQWFDKKGQGNAVLVVLKRKRTQTNVNGCKRRFRYSFICQGTSTRRQRSNLFLHTNPLKCWTSSREAVNTNF